MNATPPLAKLLLDSKNLGMHGGMIRPGQPSDQECSACQDFRWYVVQTLPNKEYQALGSISRAGYKCHLPRFVKLRKLLKNGRPVIENGKVKEEETIRPLFPGYLFVSFNARNGGWGDINWMQGVIGARHGIMMNGNRPLPVPVNEIESLIARGRAGDGAIDERAPAFAPIALNSQVKIKHGALADHVGICAMSDKDRVELLITILGGKQRVTVSRDLVEPV